MSKDQEVEIEFTHLYDDVCEIRVLLNNPVAEVKFALSVNLPRFISTLDYLAKERGRHFAVRGDEIDAANAEVTLHGI